MMTESNNNLEQISQQLIAGLVPNAANAVRLSRNLPTSNTASFAYYGSDPKYNAVMNANSNKIESMIQNGFDMIDGNVNIKDFYKSKTLEEKFASIVSANDRICDQLSATMDEVESKGVKKEEVSSNKDQIAHPISELDTSRQSSFHTSNQKSLSLPKRVIRPQSFFTVKPDNSPTPFLPILKYKPNAITALEDSQFVADPQTGDYDHPYFVELSEFENSLEDFEYVPAEFNPKPSSLDATPFVFVDSVESLGQMVSDLLTQSEIAVDLEHHSYRTYLGITCLIQISTRSTDYIVDALKLRGNLERLNEVFTNPNIVKVLHGSDMDLMWLQRDFGVYMVNLFDTGQASRVLCFARFSLSFLLETFVGIVPDKSLQTSDWRARPLSERLIAYARSDTHYLLYVAEKLRAQLDENNLLIEVLRRSCGLCHRIYKKPRVNPLGYLEKAHGDFCKTLSKRQAYAVKHLCLLRDSIGRSEDESNGFVLPNHMLHNIAEQLPKEPNGILACCNPAPILVNKYLMDFHKVVMDARDGKHVEKEIDEDRAKLKAKIEEGVKFSSTTASHSAPHEKPIADRSFSVHHTHIQEPLQVFDNKSSSYPLYCIQEGCPGLGWNNWGHQPFSYYPEQRYVVGLAKCLAPIQVPNVVINCEHIPQHTATDFNRIEDPLYKPLETLSTEEFSPVRLTQAEELEVAGLGAKFAGGRSAQSHAMTNLARKRQQRERQQQNKQQGASSKFDNPINIPNDDNEEGCDENAVAILRDLNIKKPPKGSFQSSPINRQSMTSNSIDLTTDGASSAGSGSPESAHRSKIPKTPNKNHRQDSTPSRRGTAYRGGRGRGGRNMSFSRSPATFSPQPQS